MQSTCNFQVLHHKFEEKFFNK